MTDPAPPSTRRDQLATFTDAKGNVKTWAYDALGRQTNKLYADSVGDTYRYDALGRLTNHVTGAGHTQTLAYDSRISFGNRSLA